MTQPCDYTWIAAWARNMGSMPGWARDQQQLAAATGAPLNAVYLDGNGAWHTTDDIITPAARRRLGLSPYPPSHPRVLRSWDATVIGRSGDVVSITFPRLTDMISWARDHEVPPARVIMLGMDRKPMSDPFTITYSPAT